MARTVELCKQAGVATGAHPSYPDLPGFGRRDMELSPEEVYRCVLDQSRALRVIAENAEAQLSHVKPHGALYNRAAVDWDTARAICRAVAELGDGIALFGLAGSRLIEAAHECGLPAVNEAFADRAYNDDGTLVSRSQPGAVIHNKELAVERALSMVKTGTITSISGQKTKIQADTICVHGDNPEALALVQGIREVLTNAGIQVTACR